MRNQLVSLLSPFLLTAFRPSPPPIKYSSDMADSSAEDSRSSGEGGSDAPPPSAGAGTGAAAGTGHDQPTAAPHPNMIQSILAHYSNNITDAFLMITRICTILFTIFYLFPFGGGTAYYK